MGVNFVIAMENNAGLSQEEVNAKLGVWRIDDRAHPEWACFKWEDKDYASWTSTPRYRFEIEIGDPQWEALRKYLVRVKEIFKSNEVYLSNDVLCRKMPEEGDTEKDFWIPWRLDKELLEEPDLEEFPELANIEELSGLVW